MTAQISDAVDCDGEIFSISGISNQGLFHPSTYNVTTYPYSSVCWRGFCCLYSIRNDLLVLDELEISFDPNVHPIPEAVALFGKTPTAKADFIFDLRHKYVELNHHVPFTGEIVLARDFIPEMYEHMGFHPAWKYKKVIKCRFHEGKLINKDDISSLVAESRATLAEVDKVEKATSVNRWIKKAFSLTFSLPFSQRSSRNLSEEN